MTEAMLGVHLRSWEIMNPRNLKVSTAETVLLRILMGGSVGGASPEVHYHLQSFQLTVLTENYFDEESLGFGSGPIIILTNGPNTGLQCINTK